MKGIHFTKDSEIYTQMRALKGMKHIGKILNQLTNLRETSVVRAHTHPRRI